jgi:pimeloyl-ACP methyl ester carboxylesterase
LPSGEGVLEDLRSRLRATNWPGDDGNEDGRYGVPRALLQELAEYWAEQYDWRAAERAMNAYEHYLVDVSGTRVHFMRKPGVGPDPLPLILNHGWPWTFWHWSKVIDRLADPAAFGADAADAFEVIVPSLPGFGYSTPTRPDMNFWKIADVWHDLMTQTLGIHVTAQRVATSVLSSRDSSVTSSRRAVWHSHRISSETRPVHR